MENDIEDSSGWITTDDEELGTQDKLCANCRKLDFSRALAATMPTLREMYDDLRPIPQSSFISTFSHFSASCALCNQLRLSKDEIHAELETFDLRALPLPTTFHLDPEERATASPNNLRWLRLVPQKGHTNFFEIEPAVYDAEEYGWSSCQFTDEKEEPFRPRVIAKNICFDLLRMWLSKCREFHGHTCNNSLFVPGLLLIDCETIQLARIRSNAQPPYVALSYVWAKSVNTTFETSPHTADKGQPRLPPERDLPNVVKDSIAVSVQLGFRYLWVDKYCIDQTDATAQKEYIDNMDMIYSGAELTIIAAAGQDERHGLPGIGVSIKRLHQRTVKLGRFTIRRVPKHTKAISENSTWGSRGWTYQEEVLSRRRLYFSDQQATFVCNQMECCEAWGGAELVKDAEGMERYSTVSKSILGSHLRSMIDSMALLPFESKGVELGRDADRRRLDIAVLIRDYSTRDLTYDSDALRAFAGIHRVFERGEFPIYSIQGLPVQLSSQPTQLFKHFFSALCWEHRPWEPARRRLQFPSWTWAGWTTAAHLPEEFSRSIEFEPLYENLLFEYDDGSKATLDELMKALALQQLKVMRKRNLGYSLRHNPGRVDTFATVRDAGSPITICLRAPFVNADIFSFSDPKSWDTGLFAGMHLASGDASIYGQQIPFSPRYFLDGLKMETLGCILLGFDRVSRGSSKWVKAHLMLVQWFGPTNAYRVCKLSSGRWLDQLESQQLTKATELRKKLKWRDIRLL